MIQTGKSDHYRMIAFHGILGPGDCQCIVAIIRSGLDIFFESAFICEICG